MRALALSQHPQADAGASSRKAERPPSGLARGVVRVCVCVCMCICTCCTVYVERMCVGAAALTDDHDAGSFKIIHAPNNVGHYRLQFFDGTGGQGMPSTQGEMRGYVGSGSQPYSHIEM